MKPEDREDLLAALKKIADGETTESDELRAIIEDYFQNDREGWARPWLDWRDRAAKAVGLPTSEELRALGTPNGTSADTDSGDKQNPGTKPETYRKFHLNYPDANPQD